MILSFVFCRDSVEKNETTVFVDDPKLTDPRMGKYMF